MKIRYLLLIGASLAWCSCKDKSVTAGASDAGAAKKKGSALSGPSPASGDEAKMAEGKSGERARKEKRAKVAEPAKGEPGKVISPNTGDLVDVSGRIPGELVDDPRYPGDKSKRFEVPKDVEKKTIPVAQGVPGKPGYVYSPYNNQIIDVQGIPAGRLVADPTYPAAERKTFRVPQGNEAPAPDANGIGAPGGLEEDAPGGQ
jgi:hypothetical protein